MRLAATASLIVRSEKIMPADGSGRRKAGPLLGVGRRGSACVERMRGIEPPYSAWEADVLPLNYIRRDFDCRPMSSGASSVRDQAHRAPGRNQQAHGEQPIGSSGPEFASLVLWACGPAGSDRSHTHCRAPWRARARERTARAASRDRVRPPRPQVATVATSRFRLSQRTGTIPGSPPPTNAGALP